MTEEIESSQSTDHFAAQATAGRRAALEGQAVHEQGNSMPQALALLYLRSASAKQDDRNLSIVAQQHVCQWRAHQLNAHVIDEFVDFGSGMRGERPGLDGLLAKLTELHADGEQRPTYVIARDHARIARDMQVYIRVVWAIERTGAMLNIASVPLIEYEAIAGRRSEIYSIWPTDATDKKALKETDAGDGDGLTTEE